MATKAFGQIFNFNLIFHINYRNLLVFIFIAYFLIINYF